jgi:hypothetical protein
MIPFSDQDGLRDYRTPAAGVRLTAARASCPWWLIPVAFLAGLAIGVWL